MGDYIQGREYIHRQLQAVGAPIQIATYGMDLGRPWSRVSLIVEGDHSRRKAITPTHHRRV